jgi:aspartyl-tRNA(Asn)/glutamyl-tRNA(Gln) amidotransferase subunit B
MTAPRYEMVVGLEVHVQLATRTKIFCSCSADFGALPNVNTCPVCLALPGSLPVLDETAVTLATRAALALGCTVHEVSVFARKNYFYPDLPKGYQISQFDRPLATNGAVEIEAVDGRRRRIGITRLHLEEDAGKSIHDRYPGVSAIDLNRAGVPLVEIVSEPDLRSSEDAGTYLRQLKLLLEYLDVSDANMEEGSLRVDANVSARPSGAAALGTKTEIKNMNSFSGVERALAAEFARQCTMLDRGEVVTQQTMLWDASRDEVRPARSKEESHDYRYFPDPDLPPLRLAREWIESERRRLPELPAARQARFREAYALPRSDADVLTSSRALADYFESVAAAHGDPKAAANWVMGEVLAAVRDRSAHIARFPIEPARVGRLLDLVRDGTLSHSAAKKVFAAMLTSGDSPDVIAAREGLSQVGDDELLRRWVDEVFTENAREAERLAAGEAKLVGVLVGLVMKKSGGRADPRKVNQLVRGRAGPS